LIEVLKIPVARLSVSSSIRCSPSPKTGWIPLPPAAADPHIAAAMSPPMATHPYGGWPGPNDIAASNPYPAAVPGIIAWRPHIVGARSVRNDLDQGRRRRRRRHDDCLRGRLRRHRGRWSLLPIRRRRRRSGPYPAVGGRLGRRGVGRLPGVGRLNVIHRHVFNPALRATGGQRRDARECQARGPYVSIHEIKMLHIQ
jgi:hypothetical protein